MFAVLELLFVKRLKTRKGPKNLFEIEKVRDSCKNRNLVWYVRTEP